MEWITDRNPDIAETIKHGTRQFVEEYNVATGKYVKTGMRYERTF